MKYKLGAIGFGNMGGAIIRGALSAGLFSKGDVAVFDKLIDAREKCEREGIPFLSSALELFESCEKVLFAVKPQGMEALLAELSSAKKPYPCVISIVAGYPSEKIRARLPGVHVVRVMPNTPLLLGCGATALCACDGTTDAELKAAKALFDPLGETAVLTEDKMNAVIAVNGSSPAFVYYYIEALARWGEENGLSYGDCLRLCAKTFEGAAKMVLEGKTPVPELIRRVCSPGGTTLAAMEVLEREKAGETLARAADACTKRAEELAKM